jgi:hypothetical protein
MDAKAWNDLVQVMASRGAIATDEELDEISAYMARNFSSLNTQAAPAAR